MSESKEKAACVGAQAAGDGAVGVADSSSSVYSNPPKASTGPEDSTREIDAVASGFTPVFDVIARSPDLGPVAALVFGEVWRRCQGRDGLCYAARERMADRVGLSRKTFNRHLPKLCILGYLEDLTPERQHHPHVYRDTGKVRMFVTVGTAEVGQRVPTGGTESPYRWDRESHKETPESKQQTYDAVGGQPVDNPLDPAALAALDRMGITYPSVRDELTEKRTPDQLIVFADWWEASSDCEGMGVGWLVEYIRTYPEPQTAQSRRQRNRFLSGKYADAVKR